MVDTFCIRYCCAELIGKPIAEHGYRSVICHLNYGYPRYRRLRDAEGKAGRWRPMLDREAMYYGAAAALLMGQTAYYEAGPGVPADNIYFVDLGKPLTASYEEDRAARVAWRRFENGVVVVNDTGRRARIALPPVRGIKRCWDLFSGREAPALLTGEGVTIPGSRYPATDRRVSSARIFVYAR